MEPKKLLSHSVIIGIIKCLSGLRVGGSGGIIEIGGVDNPIIRNPINGLPYIPGSSIKGKMRSLLELEKGKIMSNGDPHKHDKNICEKNNCEICILFGSSAGDGSQLGPGRLIFRDCYLTENSRNDLQKMKEREGLNYSEIKTEVNINRWTAKSISGPRQMERVPAGTSFDFELAIRVFENDNDNLVSYIKEGLKLIQNDALGGCGSRGCGRVKFENLTLDGNPVEL